MMPTFLYIRQKKLFIMEHPENDIASTGLKVNEGVERLSSINPYLSLRKRRKAAELTVDDYVAGILRGDVTVLSRAVTLVESVLPHHQEIAKQVRERDAEKQSRKKRI